MNLTWELKPFDALTTLELYDILKARQEVFIVEQTCYYLDADGLDDKSWHLMGKNGETIMAYTRILPPGLSYPEAAIGRVLTRKQARGFGLGKLLMEKSIESVEELFPGEGIRISAQQYLMKFYTELGFSSTGKKYLEDGIPHVEMTKLS